MSRPVRPSSWVTCVCGKVCKGKAGASHHFDVCPIEQARSAAFIAAVENGGNAVEASRKAVRDALARRRAAGEAL